MSHGFWGPVTATVDWCEDNYSWTHYVAEFCNTLSGLPSVLLALYALYHHRRRGHRSNLYFGIACVATLVVGLGSMVFHGTLTKEGQVLDELPLLWGVCSCFLFILMAKETHTSSDFWVVLGVLVWGVAVTVVYLVTGFEMFVFLCFVSMSATLIMGYRHTIATTDNASKQLKLDFLKFCAFSYITCITCLWMPEMLFCGNRTRHDHETIFQSLHLHALFHLLTGAAFYSFFCFAAILQLEVEGRKPHVDWCVVPVVVVLE